MLKQLLSVALFTMFICIHSYGQNSERQRILFDEGWKFYLGDPEDAHIPNLDDSSWRSLDLPHDWSIEGDFDRNAPTTGRGGYLPTGVGWYRKTFNYTSSYDKQVWIEFDGVYQNSEVWINGNSLGKYPNGYLSFYYDISTYLENGTNSLAVRVDNSHQPNSRWYSGSGIYRHVWLNIANPLHVIPWGAYITTPSVDSTFTTVSLKTVIANADVHDTQAVFVATIFNSREEEISSYQNQFVIGAKDTVRLEHTLLVKNPQLWSVKSPSLYRMEARIEIDGKLIDKVFTNFGIRNIEYSANRGFKLNGERIKMNGVCLHHGGGSVGAAVPIDVWKRRLVLLKKMGCNAIRTAHNPFAPEFLDLCDAMGFLVMNEIFDEWERGKVEFGYNKYFEEWAQHDLIKFIHRDRNHPSVVMWSAGNEIGEQSIPGGHEVLKSLLETFHREDPTRPVTTGNDHIAADGRTATDTFLNMLDIVGYNYVDRWHERRELYYSLDKINHPDWLMTGTESVSVRGVRGSYTNPFSPAEIRTAYLPSLIRAEQLWKFVSTHDYVIGDFMWTGIDYLGEARWPSKNASSGVIDLCGFPKDAYYFYQSQWTDDPVLHLFPHWDWEGRENEVIPVMAYTNCDTVELFLNDRSFGKKAIQFPRPGNSGIWNRYDVPPIGISTGDLHLTWDVPFEPGILKAVGRCKGGVVVTKEIVTSGTTSALKISIDRKKISANGLDVAHITLEAIDANGNFVPDASNLVELQISGSGNIIGFDNGNPRDHTNMKSRSRKLFNGLALVVIQATNSEGMIKLVASSSGLKSVQQEIEVTNN